MCSFTSTNCILISLFCCLTACATVRSEADPDLGHVVKRDNQEAIWVAGITLYSKGQFLAAADLLELAYRLKQAHRINQNIGMAYFKAAQLPDYPEVLRLEYVRRALPRFKSYRSWLTLDYGRTHPITQPLAETNQRIIDSERLERELRSLVEPQRATR
jgi:hypothetical protein